MNSRWDGAVEAGVALAAVLVMVGCVDVNGGAVELSWRVVEVENGMLSQCVEPTMRWKLTTMQLHGRRLSCGGDAAECDCVLPAPWDCEVGHGSTRFQFAAGDWAFEVSVGYEDTPPIVRVPDPIVRQITDGQVAQLGALLVLVGEGQAGMDAGMSRAACEN